MNRCRVLWAWTGLLVACASPTTTTFTGAPSLSSGGNGPDVGTAEDAAGVADGAADDAATVAVDAVDAAPDVPSSLDVAPVDVAPVDANVADTGAVDAGAVDAGKADVAPVDVGIADAGQTDSGPADSGVVDGGLADTGVADIKADAGSGATNSCCVAGTTPGCNDPAVQACICAKDDYCCKKAWDNICVQEVGQWQCGSCSGGGGGPDAGSTDAGGSDAGTTDAGSGGGTDTGANCTAWKAARVDMSEGAWSGASGTCAAGDMAANGRANTLKLVNLYRQMVGLPAVQMSDQWNAALQDCALMMDANSALSHQPPPNWKCYTQQGAAIAMQSNLATAPAVAAVDLYIVDPGNVQTLGHRRWILSNTLGPIGVGSTNQFSCLKVIGGQGNAGKPWVAWPPPGQVPYEAFHTFGWTSLDATGWSIQSDSINLAGAQVVVSKNGQVMPTTTQQLLNNFGSKYAIAILPQGWAAQAGDTYHVDVQGVGTSISYDVSVVGCK